MDLFFLFLMEADEKESRMEQGGQKMKGNSRVETKGSTLEEAR